MSHAIKAVLFDLDGTLLDTHDLILASFRHATSTVLGRNIPEEELLAKVGQPLDVQMRDFTDDPATVEALLETYREHNHAAHDEIVKAFPGVRAMIDELAQAGLRMGVVTSKRQALAWRGLEVCGLAERMEFVVAPDVFPEHKPASGPVAHGCELMGLDPAACLYVGDSPFDIQAGNGAGCETVAVTWGMFSLDVLEACRPAHVISQPAELAKIAVRG